MVEMEAESPEAARLATADMTVDDLARKSHSDIGVLKVAAKEIVPLASLSGADDSAEDQKPRPPRPSGWYRPR